MEVLPEIRYLTKDDPYHYTVDNRPLEDLAARDEALFEAINALLSRIAVLETNLN